MGQKVNPIGFRLGYVKGWESNWFADKDMGKKIVEDEMIRKYIHKRLDIKAAVSKLLIERTLKRITLSIHTARPGIIIGKQGAEVDKIREEIKKLTQKEVQINVIELKREQAKQSALLIANSIANRIESRASYKRVIKTAITDSMRANIKGVKIKVAGRLAGAEMARSEVFKEGSIPLHTLRADIDYALVEANTIYGKIGIKVWVFTKKFYKRPNLYGEFENKTGGKKKTPMKNTSKKLGGFNSTRRRKPMPKPVK